MAIEVWVGVGGSRGAQTRGLFQRGTNPSPWGVWLAYGGLVVQANRVRGALVCVGRLPCSC